jgi:hypothetical protein
MTWKKHLPFDIFPFLYDINISHLSGDNLFMFFLVLIWLVRIVVNENIFSEIVLGDNDKHQLKRIYSKSLW